MGGIQGSRYQVLDSKKGILHKTGNLITLYKVYEHYRDQGTQVSMWDSRNKTEAFVPDTIKVGGSRTIPLGKIGEFKIDKSSIQLRLNGQDWIELDGNCAKVLRMISNRLSARALADQMIQK